MTTHDATAIRIPAPRDPIPDTRPELRGTVLFGSRHCTAPGCHRTDCATADGVCGRRCADHPPEFSSSFAVRTALTCGFDAAMSYIRNAPEVA